MSADHCKKYSAQAKQCIKGESFFESIISEFAIPHHIVGPKDIGIDYICEWACDDRPSGVLFSVQVKSFSNETVKPQFVQKSRLNKLDSYRIRNPNFKIDLNTLHYWKGLSMPAYLFAVYTNPDESEIQCFYKRYTPVLTKDDISLDGVDYYEKFYKVNRRAQFLAFASADKRKNGFARDLFIDYMRWNYFKGSITYLNPSYIGLEQFPENNIFPELVREYEDKIKSTYSKLEKYFGSAKNSSKSADDVSGFSTLATTTDD